MLFHLLDEELLGFCVVGYPDTLCPSTFLGVSHRFSGGHRS